jgi:hypothetical protein
MINEYYAQEEEGLFYDYNSNTMRVANDQKPDSSYALSCLQTARSIVTSASSVMSVFGGAYFPSKIKITTSFGNLQG